MDDDQIRKVRSFNRAVTQSIRALESSYLERGRPLGEARVIFAVGVEGVDLRALRARLDLDSGYVSRMVRSLSREGLLEASTSPRDGRLRRIALTEKGREELQAYDRLSDRVAASMLAPLDARLRERLVEAMGEVERLIGVARMKVDFGPPAGAEARRCLDAYFQELAERFEGGYEPAKDSSAAAREMTPPIGRFVLARLDNDTVGCGGVKRVDDQTGEIKRMWVAKSVRGLGVARRMLGKLEEAAREMGLSTLRLDTNKALTEAHALYRKEGYRDVERFNDNPYAHHWFEKRL